MNVPYKTALEDVEVGSLDAATLATVREELPRIERLANAKVAVREPAGRPPTRRPASAVVVGSGFEVRVGLSGAVDLAAESARIAKEIGKLEAELEGLRRKLENPGFLAKAPPEVVEKDRARADDLVEKRSKLHTHRAMLSGTADDTARRDPMENNEQTPGAPGTPAPTQENPIVQAAQSAVAAGSEMAKNVVSAVTDAIEKVATKAKKAAKRTARKARKRVAARKAPKRKAARKVKARKPARKAARKPARKARRKAKR
jgi:valyl-tRNA synthetase